MTRLDTPEALRTAIANIWAIHEYDIKNWTPELKQAMQALQTKLLNLITIKEV